MPVIQYVRAPDAEDMDFGRLSATVTISTQGYVHKGVVLDALEYMSVQPRLIGNLYQLERTDIWFLRFTSMEEARYFADDNRAGFEFNGVSFAVKLLNCQCVEVRLHWVPDTWTEKFVGGIVKDWGTILKLHTARISARNQCVMELRLECTLQQVGAIPHLLEVSDGTRILVTVPKRSPLCLGCKQLGHIKFRCPNFIPNRSQWGVAPSQAPVSVQLQDEPRNAADQSFPPLEKAGRSLEGGAAARESGADRLKRNLMPNLEPIDRADSSIYALPPRGGGGALIVDRLAVGGAGNQSEPGMSALSGGAEVQSMDDDTCLMKVVDTVTADIVNIIGDSQVAPGQRTPPHVSNVKPISVIGNIYENLSRNSSPARSVRSARSVSPDDRQRQQSRTPTSNFSSLDRSHSGDRPALEIQDDRSPSPVRKIPQRPGEEPRPQRPPPPARPSRNKKIDAKRMKATPGTPVPEAHLSQLRSLSKTKAKTKNMDQS
jgi:hypothetical protein